MAEKHFHKQKKFTKDYLLPYFQKNIPDFHKKKFLEVGCAEGGLLEILSGLGMTAVGIEISPERAATAIKQNPELKIVVSDITSPNLSEIVTDKYDIIIMREVIEHLSDKKQAFENLDSLLNVNGYLFISFPPKRSPFAGHQQIGRSLLKTIPYLHILPVSVLKFLVRLLNEKDGYIEEIKLHFSTGCTIKTFENYSKLHKFKLINQDLYLFRPIYAIRFGLPTIKLPDIPFIREYISLGCETLLQKIVHD